MPARMRPFVAAVALWSALCVAGSAHAQPDPPADAEKLAARITELIRELDADEFAVRERAEQALTEIGQPAAAALEKAAETGSAEVRFRSRSILKALRDKSRQLQLVQQVSRGDQSCLNRVCISPDGKFLYACAWQSSAVLTFARDPKTGQIAHLDTIEDPEQLQGCTGLQLTADGKHAVAACFRSKSVVLFERNAETGRLTRKDSVREQVDGESVLAWPIDLALSPDSKHAYIIDADGRGPGSNEGGAVFVFGIADGKLTFIEANPGKDDCLQRARGIAVSPDGKSVYAITMGSNALVVLGRDAETGKTQLRQVLKDEEGDVHCLGGGQGVTCSEDGKFVYTSSGRFQGDDAIGVFAVQDDGTLKVIQELVNGEKDGLQNFEGGNEICVSRDGKFVYAAATRSHYFVCLSRDGESGKLKFIESHDPGPAGEHGPAGVCVSDDGQFVYVAVESGSTVAVYKNGAAAKEKPPEGEAKSNE